MRSHWIQLRFFAVVVLTIHFTACVSEEQPPSDATNEPSMDVAAPDVEVDLSEMGGPDVGEVADISTDSDLFERPSTLPEVAYAWADEPPANAEIVTREDFERRVTAGELVPVSIETAREQHVRAVEQERADDDVILQYELEHPRLGTILPPPPSPGDPTLTPLGDGNFLHEIERKDGRARQVVTMGQRWVKRQIAEAIVNFPTFDNQLLTYESFYQSIPEGWRDQLSLVNPQFIRDNPQQFSSEDVLELNQAIALSGEALWAVLAEGLGLPDGYPMNCDSEIRSGDGTDRSGNLYDDPRCGVQPEGIWTNYDFGLKWYTTCVKDQARRGTCVAFANASAIETHVARTQGQWVNLSEQAYYHRMLYQWDKRDYGDGYSVRKAFANMRTHAWPLPFEEQWNYNPSWDRIDVLRACRADCAGDPFCINECDAEPGNRRYLQSCNDYEESCSDSSHQSGLVCAGYPDRTLHCAYWLPDKNPDEEGYRITTHAQLWDPDNLDFSLALVILAVAVKNPVVIALNITPSWDDEHDFDGTGFVDYIGDGEGSRGGHAVQVVGAIDNETLSQVNQTAPQASGGGYLIVKNSWGNCVADGGYVYLPFDWVKAYAYGAVVLHGVVE